MQADVRNDVTCLLYTSDAADERSSVDLGGSRIIKKKKAVTYTRSTYEQAPDTGVLTHAKDIHNHITTGTTD